MALFEGLANTNNQRKNYLPRKKLVKQKEQIKQ
jgi:hypothetical protein